MRCAPSSQPDDVVVDIGTGTGVLATGAALAGARRVYAVESSGIAEVAARVFDANGVADRVTLVRERSTSVTLPERGTVLVTETIGNDPLDEQLLEIVADAKQRLLAPGARIIPSAIEIYGIAVDIPRTVLERHVFTRRKVEGYRTLTASTSRRSRTIASPAPSRSWSTTVTSRRGRSQQPVLLASIDMTGPFETVISTRASRGDLARQPEPRRHAGVPRDARAGRRHLDAARPTSIRPGTGRTRSFRPSTAHP